MIRINKTVPQTGEERQKETNKIYHINRLMYRVLRKREKNFLDFVQNMTCAGKEAVQNGNEDGEDRGGVKESYRFS